MKTIGIIGAMPSEVKDLREALGEAVIETLHHFEFHIFEYQGVRVVTVCSGIGKTNAALCAQHLISSYHADMVINAGIAGGMASSVKVCDIVISEYTMYHDLLTRFLEDYPPHCGAFPADKRLIDLAEKACTAKGIHSHIGKIISGEQFISDNGVKERLRKEFSPLAVDMESAGVGHCAYLNGVPYVSIRCISDNADDEGEMSFDQFEKIAAARVAGVIISMLEKC